MLQLEGLHVGRAGQPVLVDFSARLQPGQVHVLVGPNGGGKTTLLRALFGIETLTAGTVRLGEHRLDTRSRRARGLKAWRDAFAYMPQSNDVNAAMTVLEAVVLGRLGHLQLYVDDDVLAAAMLRLEAAGIAHLAQRIIATLSGGQRQMALFAQVLMREPKVMLLDEPVSALDLRHQMQLLDLVRRETLARGWITLLVLHDLNLACQYADNLLVLLDGRLHAAGPPRGLVDAALIRSVYGVDAEVMTDSLGNPVVQPRGRSAVRQHKETANEDPSPFSPRTAGAAV